MQNRPMTNELRDKIRTYIKNKIDISSLIDGICIKGENLSHSIIKYMNRSEDDISDCNFAYAKLGSDDKILSIIRCKMINCNFEEAEFIGKAHVRSCQAQNCNFKGANVSKADYQHTNFKGSTFCNAIIRIGTTEGIGAIFPKEMFEELCRGWSMRVEAKYLNE